MLTDTDGAHEGVVWNVSVVGAYVVTSEPAWPREGQQIEISFSLPQDPAPIKAVARVVWENRHSLWPGCGQLAAALPPGYGLEFVHLEAADRARIGARVKTAFPGARRDPPETR